MATEPQNHVVILISFTFDSTLPHRTRKQHLDKTRERYCYLEAGRYGIVEVNILISSRRAFTKTTYANYRRKTSGATSTARNVPFAIIIASRDVQKGQNVNGPWWSRRSRATGDGRGERKFALLVYLTRGSNGGTNHYFMDYSLEQKRSQEHREIRERKCKRKDKGDKGNGFGEV